MERKRENLFYMHLCICKDEIHQTDAVLANTLMNATISAFLLHCYNEGQAAATPTLRSRLQSWY